MRTQPRLMELSCSGCLLMKNVREEMTYIVDRPVEEIHRELRVGYSR